MQKLTTFRPWAPGQASLLPASPSDWLSADHQVYFLLDLVNELDLSAIVIPAQNKDHRGEKGSHARMMTLLLLYAYCAGIVSSRRIERACYEDQAFRVLTGNQQPDHGRISEFRRRNLEALSGLFVQILRFCQEAGMFSLGLVALDGTKVQANASKYKAMSHERMLKAEAQLEKEIKELMRKAEILDAQEDGKYGKGKLASDLPKELHRRHDRLEKISQARKALEAEAAAAAADAEEQADASDQHKLRKKADRSQQKAEADRDLAIEKAGEAGLEPEGLEPQAADAMPQRGLAHWADCSPKASAQRNFTDSDSHIMKSDRNLLQGYNCQAAVDGDHQVIEAMGVSNQPPDDEHLEPTLEHTIANTGACPETFIAVAAGFCVGEAFSKRSSYGLLE
jgi:transposase